MEMEQLRKSFSAKLALFIVLFFAMGHTAFAGTLRKPPNNLSLVAYWPFNEGEGTVVGDASGNRHTGTFSTTISPVWTSGKLGGGFDAGYLPTGGSTNKVAFSNITTGTTYTISAWIYLTSDCVNYGAIFAQDTVEGLYCYQNGGASNKLDFWYASTPADHFSNTPLALNQWYHVAMVNNAGSATFYLNGVADGTVSSVPTFNANSIGNDSLGEYFPGKLDEVRLYNRALSASDVYALYKSGAARIGNTASYGLFGAISQNLTAHYTFDGKNMVSNVANALNSTRAGRLSGFTSTTTIPGKVGQALRFDGVDDYVSFTNAASGFISTSAGTISVWVRPTGSAIPTGTLTYQGIPVVASQSVFNGFGISRMIIGGEDRIWVANGGGTEQKIGIPYNLDEWIHITWVHKDGILYAYKNGELVDSVASGNTTVGGIFYIGRDWDGDPDYWRGDIDEVYTWQRGLSADEVKHMYNLTLGTKVNKTQTNSLTNGLVGYWTFDGPDMYSNVADKSGNGNDGVLTNFTSTTTIIGKIGQALNFDGTNDYVFANNTSGTLKPGTGPFSVAFWYKGTRSENLITDTGSTFINGFWSISSSKYYFSTAGFGSYGYADYSLPADNEWHHFALTLDRTTSPDTFRVYLDGATLSTTGAVTTLNGGNINSTGTAIGQAYNYTNLTTRRGPMDEVRIYNRVLSAAEVLKLYRLGK